MQFSSALDCYLEYQNFIEYWCNELQVSQAFVSAVIWEESKGDPNAYRAEPHLKDASRGLMQILWGTAVWIRDNLGATYINNPEQLFDEKMNIEYGARYLRYQLLRYQNCKRCAYAGFNGGSAKFVNNFQVSKVERTYSKLIKDKDYINLHRRNKQNGKSKNTQD